MPGWLRYLGFTASLPFALPASFLSVLGEGGFSLVYKGTLTNGREVAIKRLKDTHRQPDLEFMKEVDILSLVHHRHLVSLIGFYVSELICLLVCECVPNKTLEFHLHGRNGSTLAWRHRFRISLDSAKDLEYLHEDCNPRVIHRDIKSANILLDHQFRAQHHPDPDPLASSLDPVFSISMKVQKRSASEPRIGGEGAWNMAAGAPAEGSSLRRGALGGEMLLWLGSVRGSRSILCILVRRHLPDYHKN